MHNDPGRQEYDDERETFLRKRGVRIVRFENREVFEDLEVILEEIALYFQG